MLVKNTDVSKTNKLIQNAEDMNNFLSAVLLAHKFLGKLQTSLQECQREARSQPDSNDDDARWKLEQLRQIDERNKLRRHGPAIQIDVNYLRPTSGKFYSVDMVPTIQIPIGNGKYEYYVPKPIKDAWGPQNAWRRSFSLDEKERLANIDQDQGCRKQVLRVLKVLRNREPGLQLLTSYHFKTVLFRKTDELCQPGQWSYECLGQRLMDMIAQIEKELGERVMPHYFLRGVNLLDGMSEIAIINLQQRLKHLKNSKPEMMKLLQLQPETQSVQIQRSSTFDTSTIVFYLVFAILCASFCWGVILSLILQ